MSRDGLDTIQARIGYTFSDSSLLLAALTHKSYSHEHPRRAPVHNERLEFLGDAVLGLSVVDALYRAGEMLDEARMSKVRSFIVKGRMLSDVARDIRLGEHLFLGKGEVDTGGRAKDTILADAVEAVIGAVYLDGGLHAASALVARVLGGRIHDALGTGSVRDDKTDLQELTQMRFGVLPEYRLMEETGREHEKTFTFGVYVGEDLMGTGRGPNKKSAQSGAARAALDRLLPLDGGDESAGR
jgi:ribonuclease-3